MVLPLFLCLLLCIYSSYDGHRAMTHSVNDKIPDDIEPGRGTKAEEGDSCAKGDEIAVFEGDAKAEEGDEIAVFEGDAKAEEGDEIAVFEGDAKAEEGDSCAKDDKTPVWHSGDKAESKEVRAESFRLMASVGNFGLFLLIAIIFGYFIGNALDSFFGTKPVFTVFWVVCAVIASIRELWRSIHKAKRLAED